MRMIPQKWVFGVLGVVAMLVASGCGRSEAGGGEEGGAISSGVIQAGNITILGTLTDMTDRARAKANVEDTLAKYPGVDCLVGLWSYNTPAIVQVVKQADMKGEVAIVGFDAATATLQGIVDGYVYATVVQQPYKFGYKSIKILAKLARGKTPDIPADETIEIPTKVINSSNVKKFRKRLEALQKQAGAKSAPQAPPGAPYVAFVTNNVSNFWQYAQAGVRAAERDFNVRAVFKMPPAGTSAAQKKLVSNLIATGVSGIAISPNDPITQITMINDWAQRIDVITVDSDAPKSKRYCYVGTDNYEAGRKAGRLIEQVLGPEGGSIMLFVGQMDAQNARERRRGIIDELKDRPMPDPGQEQEALTAVSG